MERLSGNERLGLWDDFGKLVVVFLGCGREMLTVTSEMDRSDREKLGTCCCSSIRLKKCDFFRERI